jgi:hypothetical protein
MNWTRIKVSLRGFLSRASQLLTWSSSCGQVKVNHMQGQALYDRSPVFNQSLLATPAGWKCRHSRFGRRFWTTLADWEAMLNRPLEERQNFQWGRLPRMLERARPQVPYYLRSIDVAEMAKR